MKLHRCVLLLAALTLAGTSGCRNSDQDAAMVDEPSAISLLTASFSSNSATKDSRVWRMLEEYTHTKLNITWSPNASYNDKVNIALASGTVPMIVKVENTRLPGVAAAIKKGDFWDIGPYLSRYPNLSQADPETLRNISLEGKIYGIYRARAPGRLGISIRKDWLDRLQLPMPQTIDDFYRVLKAFTHQDPDGNGIQDTYGLAVSKYDVPWDIMQIWFGAPNKWGEDAEGKLIPDHMTEPYREALRFFRKLYEEGLVNRDFPIADSSRWREQVTSGAAGVMLDVADTAGRLESALAETDPQAVIDVAGAISGPMGLRSLATPGYNGIYLISRNGVKTEQELLKVLDFLDKLNDLEIQRLLAFGIDGIHYTIEDGRIRFKSANEIPQEYNINDLDQLLPMIPDLKTNMFRAATPLREKAASIIQENSKIIVTNPAEALESSTYLQKGTMLDAMIVEARNHYIIGRLDDEGFDRKVEEWRQSGGDDLIREMNEAYAVNKQQ